MTIRPTFKQAAALALITLFAVNLAGCAEKNAGRVLQNKKNAPEGTTVLAVYEAWFGEGDHIVMNGSAAQCASATQTHIRAGSASRLSAIATGELEASRLRAA